MKTLSTNTLTPPQEPSRTRPTQSSPKCFGNRRGLIFLIPLFLLVMIGCAASTTSSSPAPVLQLQISHLNITETVTLDIEDPTADPPATTKTVTVRPCATIDSLTFTPLLGDTEPETGYTPTLTSTLPSAYYHDSTTPANNTSSHTVTVDDPTETDKIFKFNLVIQECATVAGFSSGAGIDGDPWIVDNDMRLDLVSKLVNGGNNDYAEGHYSMTQNIDLDAAPSSAPWRTGAGFTPIGTAASSMNGTFDCNNNVISNLTINVDAVNDIGFFGVIGSTGVVKNCGLIAATVTVSGNSQRSGILAGENSGTITYSYAIGNISGGRAIGGLIGENNGMINRVFAIVPITGQASVIGGLVGQNLGTISRSYATGNVTAMSLSAGNSGGLVGENIGSGSSIDNSYATGSIIYSRESLIGFGGLLGRYSVVTGGEISNSYATGFVTLTSGSFRVGGFIGDYGNHPIMSSYWANDVTGPNGESQVTWGLNSGSSTLPTSDEVFSRTIAQLQVGAPVTMPEMIDDPNNPGTMIPNPALVYVGWDTAIWNFTGPTTVGGTDGEYPRLIGVPCPNYQHLSVNAEGKVVNAAGEVQSCGTSLEN